MHGAERRVEERKVERRVSSTCLQVSPVRLRLQGLHLLLVAVHDVQLLLRAHRPTAGGSGGSRSELGGPRRARVGVSHVGRPASKGQRSEDTQHYLSTSTFYQGVKKNASTM